MWTGDPIGLDNDQLPSGQGEGNSLEMTGQNRAVCVPPSRWQETSAQPHLELRGAGAGNRVVLP